MCTMRLTEGKLIHVREREGGREGGRVTSPLFSLPSVWLTTQQLQSSIAFLPVNPTLSPLRNQGRQKLATLNAQEFAQLVIDILLDTKRRQAVSVQTGKLVAPRPLKPLS